ncbi:RimK family alpha-L-glutamate ligase [Streptomyces sp. NPDC004126]|uniref:RimK family alpha-L-glutamate ligase n=1 Tax=Streptomyces sp. NPDC004126 TaxID=3390695 RepID=UPI003CFEE535
MVVRAEPWESGPQAGASPVWLLLGPAMRGRLSRLLAASFGEAFGPGSAVLSERLVYGIRGGELTLSDLDGRPMAVPRVVYARFSTDRIVTDREITLLRHLRRMGVRVVNDAEAYLVCMNKFQQLQDLATAGLPVPDTESYADALLAEVVERTRPWEGPRVVKAARGNRGSRVFLAPDAGMLADVEGSLRQDVPYLFQEYLASSRGRDLRVVVVGGQAVAAEVRTNTGGGFKSNLARGGTPDPCPGRYPEGEELAVRAAKALGVDVAGVDLLFTADGGFVVCEVNPCPNWTEVLPQVAPAIVAACRKRAAGG